MVHQVTKGFLVIGAVVIACAACSETAPPPPPAAAPATSAPAEAPPVTGAAATQASEPPASQPARPPVTAPPPTTSPAAPAAPADPTVAVFAGYHAPKPVTWLWQPPQNRMRAANYVVPGASGEDQAHVVVFHGIGGGTQANIDRWTGQFRSPEGGPVEPKVESMTVDGVPVTVVELAGEQMGTGARWYTPDRLFIAALIDGPGGQVQAVLSGSTATVDANREAFMSLIKGLKYVGDG